MSDEYLVIRVDDTQDLQGELEAAADDDTCRLDLSQRVMAIRSS